MSVDAGEVSMAVLTVVVEVGQSMGQHVMDVRVRDEAFPGATDTFVGAQGASGEAAEDCWRSLITKSYCQIRHKKRRTSISYPHMLSILTYFHMY